MTDREYAIRSFREVTINEDRHTEERMNYYYERMKAIMEAYQDLLKFNQDTLEELEEECQEQINADMAYALQYIGTYDYRINIGKLREEVNNMILIYGLSDMIHRAMILVKYFVQKYGEEYCDVLYASFCRSQKAPDVDIMLELGMGKTTFYRKKKNALKELGYYFFEIVVPQSGKKLRIK